MVSMGKKNPIFRPDCKNPIFCSQWRALNRLNKKKIMFGHNLFWVNSIISNTVVGKNE